MKRKSIPTFEAKVRSKLDASPSLPKKKKKKKEKKERKEKEKKKPSLPSHPAFCSGLLSSCSQSRPLPSHRTMTSPRTSRQKPNQVTFEIIQATWHKVINNILRIWFLACLRTASKNLVLILKTCAQSFHLLLGLAFIICRLYLKSPVSQLCS